MIKDFFFCFQIGFFFLNSLFTLLFHLILFLFGIFFGLIFIVVITFLRLDAKIIFGVMLHPQHFYNKSYMTSCYW